MKTLLIIFAITFSFQGAVLADGSSPQEQTVTSWEEAIASTSKEALTELILNPNIGWPTIASDHITLPSSGSDLQRRAVLIANQVIGFIKNRLNSDRPFTAANLLETARLTSALSRKMETSQGLPNNLLSESLARVSVHCLARLAIASKEHQPDARRLWKEMLDFKQPPSAADFLLRYTAEDELIVVQKLAIEQLPRTTNYVAAVFVIGDQLPDLQEKMANSQVWKQLIEMGKTQVLLRVSVPTFFSYTEANGDWKSLSDANVDSLFSKLPASEPRCSFPLMQVKRPSPSQVRSLYESVATDSAFVTSTVRFLNELKSSSR